MNPNFPKAVPLVTYSESRGYSIHSEAIQVLRMLPEDDNYAVITTVGKSKTGKSFLLNQILDDQSMFPVSSHLGNCTKGIMLATNFIQVDSKKVLVLDTEGFGSIEGNDDRDCKLFILSLLLSSVVIYNSLGTIDQQTLNNLSMIIEVGKMFEKQLDNKKSIPGLFWTLRDFSLQLLDKSGFPITPVEYLQSSLEEQKGSSQTINHKNRIRRVIKTLFTDRSCSTLVLPNDEVPSSEFNGQLRPEFTEDVKRCRKKLDAMINKKGVKQFCGQKMTISSFIDALQIYVDSFNRSLSDGTMPKIQNLTYQLRQNQARGYRNKFKQLIAQQKHVVINELLSLYENDEKSGRESERIRILSPLETCFNTMMHNVFQLTGEKDSQLEKLRFSFLQEVERQCEEFLQMREQYNEKSDEADELEMHNLCEFFAHVSDENELDQEYSVQIHRLKAKAIKSDRHVFSNMLMKMEISYLRRKLQLCKQKHIDTERVVIELQYAKKQISRLESKNKELEQTLAKQNKQSFVTPIKNESEYEQKNQRSVNASTFGKQPGHIRTVNHNSIEKFNSKSIHRAASSSKIESSSFYVPYVLIHKSQYLTTTIVKTLIKEDSKRNNYIEYVIDVNLMGQKWPLHRKFKDFSELHSILIMMFQNQRLPDCKSIVGPLKMMDSNSSSRKQVVEQRRRELQNYLLELIQNQNIRNSRILQKFLKINKEYTVL